MLVERQMIGKRRDRVIATILGFKEDSCDEYLPDDVSDKLRKVILDQINDVCNYAIDIAEEKTVVNEEFLKRLVSLEE